MKNHLLLLCFLLLLSPVLFAQNFLNGSFESNTGGCQYNIPNASYNVSMQNSIGFGTASQLDIIETSCGYGAAQSGNWFVAMAIDITGTQSDALSLELSSALTAGATYTLTYYDRKDPGYATNPLEIGVSNTDYLFGTQIYLSPAPVLNWTLHTVTFTAPFNARYITMHMVGNAYSWTHIDNFSITQSSPGPPTANASSTNATCSNACAGSATVIASSGTPPYGYLWLPGGDTTASVNNLCAGTYVVSVTDSLGNTASDTITITAPTVPLVDLGTDQNLCSGQNYTLDAANAGSTYLWQDNSIAQTLTVNASGVYWVEVNNGSCSSADTVNITFGSAGTLNLGNDTSVCSPNTVVLNASTPSAIYLWQDSSTQATLSVTQSGTYSVTVDVAGCVAKDTINISITNLAPPSITAGANIVCSGDSLELCINGYTNYNWNTGEITACIQAKNAGNYYATVTDQNNCTAQSNHFALNVYPVPSVSVTVNGDTLKTGNAVAYQWYLNGNPINDATSQIYIAQGSGNYTVAITDTNGCSAVSNPIAVTGFRDIVEQSINVYPNPSAQGWYLSVGKDLIGSEVEVIDAAGRLVLESVIGAEEMFINKPVAAGTYLLRINNRYSIVTKKLVALE